MGSGNFPQILLHFPHLHFPHLLHHGHHSSSGDHKKYEVRDIPKGCLAIMVGQEEEEQQRFVVPVIYFSHPLFMQLLKQAEEEYGFEHKGPITIPCHVAHFRYVQGIIDKDQTYHHHHHHHHHHHQHVFCFRAS